MATMAFDADEAIHRLSSRLKMRHLVLLLRIQQLGSLTRVAEAMATSQPAVTNALSELEAMFGAPLFERSTRGMAPTALGRVALARAQAMIHDLGHLARDMQAVADGHAAHLHLGVTPFIPGRLLSAAIQRMLVNGRRLTVTLHEGTSDQLVHLLRDHTLDLVLGRASMAVDMRDVTFDVLYHQQPRLIANRRLAAQLSRHRFGWQQLTDLDWILGAPRTPIREQVNNLFLQAGVAPPVPVVESYSTKLIGEMIAASERAVSLVPADIAEELVRIAGVAIVPYSFTWTLPPIALFSRPGGLHREVEAEFGVALRVVCQEGAQGR